jgi:hypothetical protein
VVPPPLPDITQDLVRGCELGFAAVSASPTPESIRSFGLLMARQQALAPGLKTRAGG